MFIASYNAFSPADCILAIVLGLLFGSFCGALVYRFRHGLPFGWDHKGGAVRSICPPCGRTLKVWELIPLFAWVFLRGRCACRRTKLSVFYPLTEGVVGLLTLYIVAKSGWGIITLTSMILFPFLVAGIIVQAIFIYEDARGASGGSRFLFKRVLYLVGLLGGLITLLLI